MPSTTDFISTTPTGSSIARYSVRGVAANISLIDGPNILPIGSLVVSNLLSSGRMEADEYDPLSWRTANQITVSKTGHYRVDVNVVHSTDNLSGVSDQDAVGVSRAGIRINGTSIEWLGMDDTAGLADQMSGFIVRSFTAGDEINVVANATSAAANEDFYVSFAMEEQSTTTVVNPDTVPVNDQGASGYFDIGSVRYQWGIIPTSSGSFTLHNLPAPFANANYSISGNNIGDFNTIGFSGRTTTTFTYISVTNTGGGGSGAVSFIAIGLKP